MEYNVCSICGANDGRAGILIGNDNMGWPPACLNCHDTRTKGEIVIHNNLKRTDEEIKKTFAIISKKPLKLEAFLITSMFKIDK